MLDVTKRQFTMLLGGAAAWPRPARAQQPAMPVIGILASAGNLVSAFHKGLSETGYVEGRNLAVELRSTRQYDLLPAMAAELVRLQVAVIAAIGANAAPAAKAAAATIPIVFATGGDPVELGLVDRLNRPGGNITRVTFFAAQLLQKQVGILHDLVPKAAVFGALVNPDNQRHAADAESVRAAARALGLQVHVAGAASERHLDAAFAELVRRNAQAIVVAGDAFFTQAGARLAALAVQHALPAIYSSRELAEIGGLVTYGASVTDATRRAGVYAGRILRGERPGDLPVMQPSKFELVINLKAAKALGLVVPNSMQLLADEVIE
jgi:putative ABC transport system substrate-binding protein